MNGLMSVLTVAVVAAAPISELRGAIPLAIHTFGFSALAAVLIAIAGNMVPAVLIIFFLEPCLRWLSRYIPWLSRFMDGWLTRARRKVKKEIDRYGMIGLIIFVGIPLPLTGAWTGAAGAVLMGLPKNKAIAACAGGILVSAAIVLAIDLGAVSFFSFLLK